MTREAAPDSQSQIDAALDLVCFTSRSIPLSWMLEGAAVRMARALRVPVVSIYLLDDDQNTLVMRSNTGYNLSNLGHIRIPIGEGLTGLAVRSRCPVWVASCPEHANNHPVPEIDEARYPVLAAAPMFCDDQVIGAIVARREQGAFAAHEVALLVTMAGVVGAALRNSEQTEHARPVRPTRRRAGGGTRRVVLPGRPAVQGRVLGPLAAVRRPPRRSVLSDAAKTASRLADAFATAQRVLRDLAAKASRSGLGSEAGFLDVYLQILGDSRFRGRSIELISEGAGSGAALGQVAAEAVRTATRLTRSSFLEQRSRDIEDLCDALAMLALSDPRAAMPSHTVLMSDMLTVYDLLVTARSRPVGIALTERAGGPRTSVLLQLMGVPAVLDVAGLFRWASDGDIALLDATHGLLLINPSRAEVVELRASLESQAGKATSESAVDFK
jgi:phosphotransferase system, enzyme I, PtsP